MHRRQNLSSSTIRRLTFHGVLLGRLWLATILFATSFAAAIPLRIGKSWVWQVSDRGSTYATYRSARVLDSHSVEQGKVWALEARDSMDGRRDTARILELPGGRQMWLEVSPLLRWELQPYQEPDTAYVVVEGDTASDWGAASTGYIPIYASWGLKVDEKIFGKVSAATIEYPSANASLRIPRPLLLWNDSLELERALIYTSPNYGDKFHPEVWGWEWRLVSHNERPLAVDKDSLFLPEVGTKIRWRVSFYSSKATGGTRVSLLEWRIREMLSDSLDWKRMGIESKETRCTQTRLITNTNPSGIVVDSPCVDTSHLSIRMRINSRTGQSFSNPPLTWKPQLGWIRLWEDSVWSDTSRSSGFLFESIRGFPRDTRTLDIRFKRNQNQISYWLSHDINYGRYQYTEYSSSETVNAILLKVIPPGADSSDTGLRAPYPSPAPQTLAMIAAEHPSLAIRWSTASGRTGSLAASEFVRSSAAMRGKTLFLQARLPDGRVWQGTLVVP